MTEAHSSVGILLLFPLGLVTIASIALWLMTLYYMSKASGWRDLAQRHRLSTRFAGQKWRFCSGAFKGEVFYRCVMTVGANEGGLYLALAAPFSCCHPPILIPWKLVRVSTEERHHGKAALELGESPAVKVNINPNVLHHLERLVPHMISV